MQDKIMIYPADIRNHLYEAGILRENEDVVMVAGQCALLENAGEIRTTYRAINLFDYRTRYLCARKTPFPQESYKIVAKRLSELEINELDENMELELDENKRAQHLLSYIFDVILPQYGMAKRKSQKELALSMLRALQENKLALCEAEVGTGKTHAYILAVTIHNLFSQSKTPTMISTSTIALQEAITKEYIPQISRILLEHRIIDKPLSFVVRKGKSHFVCDSRLKTYESSIRNQNRPEDQGLLAQLGELWREQEHYLDLDGFPLTPYVKERINVSQCSEFCPHSSYCRFASFSRRWQSESYDFQISNHNYILADVVNRREGKKKLLPYYNIAVFDEAHKLIDAARQIYCTRLSENEIPKLIHLISPERFVDKSSQRQMMELCTGLSEKNTRLFQKTGGAFIQSNQMENISRTIEEDRSTRLWIRDLIGMLEKLGRIFVTVKMDSCGRVKTIRNTAQSIEDRLNVFLSAKQNISWIEKSDSGGLEFCSLPRELERILYHDLWHTGVHSIITSGTISVGGNFDHFKRMTGIDLLQPQNRRVMEVSKLSPFNYSQNAILYIPEELPFPDIHDEKYIEAISREIIHLICATFGHTLILFSSYWLMERIFYEVKQEIQSFPLFIMKRGRMDMIEKFRRSGNGVLFASDSAGEGIDLPGDILSSVIIVKLPFPVPSPILEYERTKYDDFSQYVKEIITPGMIIKLRQWFGRGIRRETDTAVFSILDSRVGIHGRYRDDVLKALPDMPVTGRIEEIRRFIAEKKTGEYFLL